MATNLQPEAAIDLLQVTRDELVQGGGAGQLVSQTGEVAVPGEPQPGRRCDSAHRELIAQFAGLSDSKSPSQPTGITR